MSRLIQWLKQVVVGTSEIADVVYELEVKDPWGFVDVKILNGHGYTIFRKFGDGKEQATVRLSQKNENTELQVNFYSEVCNCSKQMFVKLSDIV